MVGEIAVLMAPMRSRTRWSGNARGPREHWRTIVENLSSIAFAVRRALAVDGYQLSIGHAQQLVAAALGHNNLASYQSSGDDRGLDEAHEIAIDSERLEQRAADLGHAEAELRNPIVEALQARLVDAKNVHRDIEAYLIGLQEFVDDRVVQNDAVNSEVAMTNGTFPMADLELPLWNDFDIETRDDINVEFGGLVTVTQDDERAYWGHEVEVDATLYVERFGRVLFGKGQLTVERAQLRWMGEPSSSADPDSNLESVGVN